MSRYETKQAPGVVEFTVTGMGKRRQEVRVRDANDIGVRYRRTAVGRRGNPHTIKIEIVDKPPQPRS